MTIDTDTPMMAKAEFRTALDKWLWANRRTGAWLADRCGVHPSLISFVRSGERPPSHELRVKLMRVTGLKKL